MSVEINVKFENTTEKFVEAWKYYFKKEHKNDIVINLILVSLAVLIGLLFNYPGLTLIVVLLCGGYLLFIYYFKYSSVIKFIKSNKKYYQNYSVVLTDHNIQIYNDFAESSTKWDAYPSAIKTKKFYFLFDISRRFLLIPREIFRNEEEELWFENKVSDKRVKEIK